MTSEQRNIAGFAMLGAGLVILLIAALVAWAAVQRWFAAVETRDAFSQLRRGRVADARKLAASAAARVPEEPAPALLATDPKDSAALDRLMWIAVPCPRQADRQAVFASIGLMRLAAGKPADVDLAGTADGRLLEAIAAALAGTDPGESKPVDGEDPPHINVLRASHTVLLRHAWQEGQVREACAHAGALLLLRPTAPEARAVRFLVAAGSPDKPDSDVVQLGDEVKNDRESVIRAVADLVPQRRKAFAAKWPRLFEGVP